MAILSKESILSVSDLKTERVKVPEWGEDAEVIVSELDGAAMEELSKHNYFVSEKGDVTFNRDGFVSRVVAACLVDEAGNKLFTLEEAELLTKKSGKAIHRIFGVADKLNALTGAARDGVEKN